jgi:hypothetical protein
MTQSECFERASSDGSIWAQSSWLSCRLSDLSDANTNSILLVVHVLEVGTAPNLRGTNYLQTEGQFPGPGHRIRLTAQQRLLGQESRLLAKRSSRRKYEAEENRDAPLLAWTNPHVRTDSPSGFPISWAFVVPQDPTSPFWVPLLASSRISGGTTSRVLRSVFLRV